MVKSPPPQNDILPPPPRKKKSNWIQIFEKLLDIRQKHYLKLTKTPLVLPQLPHWCYPNCLRLVWRQRRAQTMCNLFKDHILVAEALRCNADECREIFVHCVRRGEWTTSVTQRACTVLYRSQRGVAILSVIFFPDSTFKLSYRSLEIISFELSYSCWSLGCWAMN